MFSSQTLQFNAQLVQMLVWRQRSRRLPAQTQAHQRRKYRPSMAQQGRPNPFKIPSNSFKFLFRFSLKTCITCHSFQLLVPISAHHSRASLRFLKTFATPNPSPLPPAPPPPSPPCRRTTPPPWALSVLAAQHQPPTIPTRCTAARPLDRPCPAQTPESSSCCSSPTR
jgi:hypothetical protein